MNRNSVHIGLLIKTLILGIVMLFQAQVLSATNANDSVIDVPNYLIARWQRGLVGADVMASCPITVPAASRRGYGARHCGDGECRNALLKPASTLGRGDMPTSRFTNANAIGLNIFAFALARA